MGNDPPSGEIRFVVREEIQPLCRKVDDMHLAMHGDPSDPRKPGVVGRVAYLEQVGRVAVKIGVVIMTGVILGAGSVFYQAVQTSHDAANDAKWRQKMMDRMEARDRRERSDDDRMSAVLPSDRSDS